MTDKAYKMIFGMALAALAALPAFAQDPSPGCDDGEVLINGECAELEDTIIVTGSRDGSSGGQSGLGGGTGANYQGSSNNGYSGRSGGNVPSAQEQFESATQQYTDPNARGPEGERYNDPRFQLGGNPGGYEDFTRASCYAAGAAAVGRFCFGASTGGAAAGCSAVGGYLTYLACN